MARRQPRKSAPRLTLNSLLEARLQTEYAAPRSIRSPADRDLTVRWRNRHRLIKRHEFTVDHPAAGCGRCACVALAVVVATAPFAGAILESAAINPAVMRQCSGCSKKCGNKDK